MIQQSVDRDISSSREFSENPVNTDCNRDNNIEDRLPSLMYPVPDVDDGFITELFEIMHMNEAPVAPTPSIPQPTSIMSEPPRSAVYSSATLQAQCQV